MARAVDTKPARRYLGPCACGTDLYARATAVTVTCQGCGTPWDVGQRLDWLDGQARQCAYTPAEIEGAYGVRADLIRKWASRNRLALRGHDRMGRPLYRLAEVLELATRVDSKRERMAA